jgi:DSF synthase
MQVTPQTTSTDKHSLEGNYTQVAIRFDRELGILWTLLNPGAVPCFNIGLLQELRHHHDAIEKSGGSLWINDQLYPIRYSVAASLVPGVFNLGGQLALFGQLIRNRDRDSLLHYATKCVDVVAQRALHFNLPLVTITLLQGDALGGGLEAALTSDIMIAERSSLMGFPEILFNLFPGMGAYSLVARKVGTKLAEEIILSGKLYSAEEFHDMGLVDILVEDGEGERAVHDYIEKQERRANGFLAVQKARHRYNPVTYQELMDITYVWVDAALKLSERDLKVMDRFVRSQEKLFVKPDVSRQPAMSGKLRLA